METITKMMLLRLTLTLTLLIGAGLGPNVVHAQQPQGAPTPVASAAAVAATAPANSSAERAIKQMIGKLRDVQAAEDLHLNDHGTYTTSMTALGRYDTRLAPPRGKAHRPDSVSVQVIFAGGRGWTGIASHWGLRGRSCVVYVGIAEELPKLPITRADRRTPTEEGVPACDSAPAPAPGAAPPSLSAPAPAPAPAQPPRR
jgi:hypothetical protein